MGIAAFRSLLSDKQIECDWKWKKVLPKIVSDQRYNALTKLDDKKNELIAWQQDEKRRIEEEERSLRHKLKRDYFDLLDEMESKIVRKEYRKAKHYLESDGRYQAIQKKHRREDWFDEWQKNAYKEYKRKKKKQKEFAIQQFTEKLRESNVVIFDAKKTKPKWSEVRECEKLEFLKKEDLFKEISDRTQKKIYDDLYQELKSKKKLKWKEDRNNFGLLIDELIKNKKIHCRCRYDDDLVVKLMENDERYKLMKHEQEHKIADIFNDKLDELKYELIDDKKVFRQFLKSNTLEIKESENLCDVVSRFKELMIDGNNEEIKKLSDDHIDLLLMEYVAKKKEKEKENNLKSNGTTKKKKRN